MVTAYLVLLMWTVPQTRTDGSALDGRDIGYYAIYRNGEEWDATTATSYEAARNGTYTVRCVLTDGSASDDSNSLRIRMKGKKR